MRIEVLLGAAITGIGATLILDLWSIFLRLAFKVPSPNFCLVGRWLRHMADGVFSHVNIMAAAQKPAECAIGWIAHYIIGVLFALSFVLLATPAWLASPTPVPALIFGIVTVAFPFFIMHPGFGLGVAASKAPNPTEARVRSLLSHAVFGAGLYISAVLLSFVGIAAA